VLGRVLNQAQRRDLSFGVLQFGREYRWHGTGGNTRSAARIFSNAVAHDAAIFSRSDGRDFCGVRDGVDDFGSEIVASGQSSMAGGAAAGIRGDDGIFRGDVISQRAACAIVVCGKFL
jgi:hypothetical protein